jgi:hypothetical protein
VEQIQTPSLLQVHEAHVGHGFRASLLKDLLQVLH